MRGSHLLASPIQQEICIFCACRLQVRAQSARPRPRPQIRSRDFSTTSRSSQETQRAANGISSPLWSAAPRTQSDRASLKKNSPRPVVRSVKVVAQTAQNGSKNNARNQAGRQSTSSRSENWAKSRNKTNPEPAPAKRVAAPSFLAGAEEETSDSVKESGWGRGSTQISAVQYGTRPEEIPLPREEKQVPWTLSGTASTTQNDGQTEHGTQSEAQQALNRPRQTPWAEQNDPAMKETSIRWVKPAEPAVPKIRIHGTSPTPRATYPGVETGFSGNVVPPQSGAPFGDSGYQSKMLTSDDLLAMIENGQDRKADSWKHLQPTPAPEAPTSPEVALENTIPSPTAASIDQQFEEYRRKREAERHNQSLTTFRPAIPFDTPTRSQSSSISSTATPDRPSASSNPSLQSTYSSDKAETVLKLPSLETRQWKGFNLTQSLDSAAEAEHDFGISQQEDLFQPPEPALRSNPATTQQSGSDGFSRLLSATKLPQPDAQKRSRENHSLDWVDAAFSKNTPSQSSPDSQSQTSSPSQPASQPASTISSVKEQRRSGYNETVWRPTLEQPDNQRTDFDDNAARSNAASRERMSDADRSRDTIERALRSSRFGDRPSRERRKGRGRDDEDDARYDDDDDFRAKAKVRAARKAEKEGKRQAEKEEKARALAEQREADGKPISLPEYITAAQLAQALHVHYDKFVKNLEKLGYEDVFANKVFNAETSAMIAIEYGFNPSLAEEDVDGGRDLKAQPELEDKSLLPTRPPVVTIMGHVDHGKTTILDYLRHANVVAGEAGGITQHIGAFSVYLENSEKSITFLDTPGHAAFLAMRQRGANVTDIVVLVVAADDSVKPQTLEALKHARAANVPIIVAVNKIDKPEADLTKVKQDLARHSIEIEDFGGDTQVIPVSGKTGQGMKELEEAIVLQSEILDHRAEDDGAVEGWVIEATTKERGRVATVLVRRGTLKIGTIIVAGKTWARVRSLHDDTGREVNEASPGIPVEVDGWRDQPIAGDEVLQAASEQKAADVVEYREEQADRKKLAVDTEAINEARIQEQMKREEAAARAEAGEDAEIDRTKDKSGGQIVVPFVVKADVSGSAEAIEAYVMGVSSPLITPQILNASVGQVNESDIELAAAAQGHVIAFNLQTSEGIKGLAAMHKVKLLEHNIIYRVTEEVKEVLEDMLPAVITQKVTGEAVIAQPFEISLGGRKKMKIAGCRVSNGVVTRSSRVRVYRGGIGGEKVFDGSLSSLKHVKRDVTEMRKGSECGMAFESWQDFLPDDIVQCYSEVSQKRSLSG